MPRQRRRRILDAVRQLVVRASRVRALGVVLEDLHWLDEESQAVLDRLVDSLPAARILFLVSYRPEYEHAWANKSSYTQLRVAPLDQGQAELLLSDLLGVDAGLAALKRMLVERAEGNPFFLEESVRHLVGTGALAGRRGAYRAAKRTDAPRSRPPSRPCWRPASTGCRRRRRSCSRPPPSSARMSR
jgi:predicted ATPase